MPFLDKLIKFQTYINSNYNKYEKTFDILSWSPKLIAMPLKMRKVSKENKESNWEYHYEQQSDDIQSQGRILTFMYYLNDIEEGGETEFVYQDRLKIKPTTGTLLIWPAGFTHTHRALPIINGIDTPESRTKDPEEKFYGNLSKTFLNDYCPKGSYITLKTHLDKKGKFGRILGEIIVNKVNLNEQMIEENLAVSYQGQSKQDIQKEHQVNRVALNRKGYVYY